VAFFAAWLIRFWDSSAFRGLVVLLLAVVLFWAFYAWGMSVGNERAKVDERARADIALAKMDAQYRAKEAGHAKAVEQIRMDFTAAQATARADDARVSRDLADGSRRMRFKAARCSPSAPALGPTPGRADGAADAELAPEVAGSLYAIAADGDQAIRQLGALQAWARSAVALCGGK
jgi:hypothetical protein